MQSHDTEGTNLQVLVGDFNAEPDEPAIQFLQGLAPLSAGRGSPVYTDFQDAWLTAGHEEPQARSQDPAERMHALTFPSDDPKKRIDLVLFRGGASRVRDVSAALIAQEPEISTVNDPGHGMLDRDSPLWASDHRGLLATFRLKVSHVSEVSEKVDL